ncbi:E3 ubiquitin-protein ligase TRIM32-like isoform X2 [Pyxicephalus adspersus]|uniref:E3 ubiquitin-protein ligase TRIM32-like isoform X2 n=1 Tax=Pyxicephalus adspersus TaxID=30357 RepID=UPI003B595431
MHEFNKEWKLSGIKRIFYNSLVGELGGFGLEDGKFIWPTSVTITLDGDLAIKDTGNHQIQIFSPEGYHKQTFSYGSENTKCLGDVACTNEGLLLVSNGSKGIKDEDLLVTEGQLFGHHSSGCLKVIDSDRTIKKTIGPTYGNFNFVNPSGVCVDGNGNFFIADKWRNNITMFNPNSSLMAAVVTHDLEGPCGITIANNDLLVVADCYHHTVKLYKYKQAILL